MLDVCMYTKSEKEVRLAPIELLQVPSFFSLCCYLTALKINLSNHMKKMRDCFITAFEEFNKDFKELFTNLKEKGCFLRKPIELSSLIRVVKSELGYD